MRTACRMILSLCLLGACASPTQGTLPPSGPAGTLLVTALGGADQGSYLVELADGTVTRIIDGLSPLYFPGIGGYSAVDNSVFGAAYPDPDRRNRIGRLNLATMVFDTLLEWAPELWKGSLDLSSDGRTIVLQTGGAGGVRLWTVDLASGTWTQRIDTVQRLDTVPLTSLKWTPDARHVYALTEVYPLTVTELIRFTLATNEFEVLTPRTRYGIVPGVDVSPDGLRLVHSDGEGRLVFRDLLGNPLPDLPSAGPRPKTTQPVFSSDGRFVAFTVYDGANPSIEIIRLSDGMRWPLELQKEFEFGIAVVDWF